jgi:competence protein ComEC
MQKIPAVKFLIFFFLGLVLSLVIKTNSILSLIMLVIALIAVILMVRYVYLRKFYPIIVIIAGLVFAQNIENRNLNYPDKIIPDFKALLKGKVVKVINEKEKYKKVLVKGTLDANIFSKIDDVKVLLTVYGKGVNKLKLQEGTFIRVNAGVHVPRKAVLAEDFNEYNYARSSGFQFFCDAHSSQVGIISHPETYNNLLNSLRKDIKSRIDILFSKDNSGIIKALLTGDKSFIARETKRDFAETGTAHVLAISGLHIGIIATVIIILLGFIRNRIVKFILFVLFLTAFVLLTGSHPSSIRAAVMAVLIYLAWLSQRDINLLNILSFAVLIIIFFQPQMIYNIGFQMSAGALFGIALFYEPFRNLFAKFIKGDNTFVQFVRTSLSLTFSVSIIIAPIVGYYFGNFSIVAPLANLFIVPLITLVLIYAMLSVFFSYVFVPFALLFATTADLCIDLIKVINSFLSNINISPDSSLIVPFAITFSLGALYILYAKSAKQMFFRIAVTSAVILLIVLLLNSGNEAFVKSYARTDVVMIEARKESQNIFIIIDRNDKPSYMTDIGLIKHIEMSEAPGKVIYTGAAGKSIVEKLPKNKQLQIFHVNLNDAMRLIEYLGFDYRIIQNISIQT